MHRINKKKKFDQKEKFTTTNLNKIGHFYFGKNRTFLFWLDTARPQNLDRSLKKGRKEQALLV